MKTFLTGVFISLSLLLNSSEVGNLTEENIPPTVVESVKPKINTPKKKVVVKIYKNKKIDSFVVGYGGSRINANYLKVLRHQCGDEKLLAKVVAMSVAETGMGRDTRNNSNFWGWFPSGNRGYDPSRKEMARVICNGVKKYYYNMTPERIKTYTGNDRTSNWGRIYLWAMNQM